MVRIKEEGDYFHEYYLKNKEAYAARAKARYLENKKGLIKVNSMWAKNNPEKTRELKRKSRIKAKTLLTDAYIKNLLRMQGFKTEQMTLELIELKRNIIKTERLCRQLKA